MEVKIKIDCIACYGSGRKTSGCYATDEIPKTAKCLQCKGHGYVFRTEEVPDDVQEEGIHPYGTAPWEEEFDEWEKNHPRWDDGLIPGEMIF